MALKKKARQKAKEIPSVKISKFTLALSVIVLIALVVFVVTHVGEAKRFGKLLTEARPAWLLLAIGIQVATYACAGAIWKVVAQSTNHKIPLTALARLAIEKLSVDQVVPTGGMAGNIVVFQAMRNLGLPQGLAMEALLIDTLAYYAAYFVAILGTLIALGVDHAMNHTILVIVGIFSIILIGIPAAIGWFLKHKGRKPPRWMQRIKPIAKLIEMVKEVSAKRVMRPKVLAYSGLLNLSIFVLDSLTLWVMMHAIGIDVSMVTTFVALVIASVSGAISFLPGGIGGFEVGSTTALTLLGIPMEAALAGTMLLRGLILWLPLVPGLLMARRDVHISIR